MPVRERGLSEWRAAAHADRKFGMRWSTRPRLSDCPEKMTKASAAYSAQSDRRIVVVRGTRSSIIPVQQRGARVRFAEQFDDRGARPEMDAAFPDAQASSLTRSHYGMTRFTELKLNADIVCSVTGKRRPSRENGDRVAENIHPPQYRQSRGYRVIPPASPNLPVAASDCLAEYSPKSNRRSIVSCRHGSHDERCQTIDHPRVRVRNSFPRRIAWQ